MHHFYDYQTYIFDCDGVILNSNSLKIDCMQIALESIDDIENGVDQCLEYFKGNFGKSRYHHVDIFLSDILQLRKPTSFEGVRNEILKNYDECLEKKYISSEFLDNFQTMIEQVKGDIYVASGSEESQLRRVLAAKGVAANFKEIQGSPKKKIDIVRAIKSKAENKKAILMIGDSIADLEAAKANNVTFLGIKDKSNTPEELKNACIENEYECIGKWSEVLKVHE